MPMLLPLALGEERLPDLALFFPPAFAASFFWPALFPAEASAATKELPSSKAAPATIIPVRNMPVIPTDDMSLRHSAYDSEGFKTRPLNKGAEHPGHHFDKRWRAEANPYSFNIPVADGRLAECASPRVIKKVNPAGSSDRARGSDLRWIARIITGP